MNIIEVDGQIISNHYDLLLPVSSHSLGVRALLFKRRSCIAHQRQSLVRACVHGWLMEPDSVTDVGRLVVGSVIC